MPESLLHARLDDAIDMLDDATLIGRTLIGPGIATRPLTLLAVKRHPYPGIWYAMEGDEHHPVLVTGAVLADWSVLLPATTTHAMWDAVADREDAFARNAA
jgi:hypothetical protein